LSGSPTSALDVGAQPISKLEDIFGGSFQPVSGQSEIESILEGKDRAREESSLAPAEPAQSGTPGMQSIKRRGPILGLKGLSQRLT
jgi:hypothetical protein